MKKPIIILLALFAFLQTFSQDSYLVRHKPQNTNGFVVLENNFSVDVSYWSVEIILNFYEDFELVNQEVLKSFELIGKNYMEIPKEFKNMENLSLRIIAHFANQTYIEENVEISTQVFGGPDWEVFQFFPCVGSTYAYEIVQYKHKTVDKSRLVLQPTAEQTDPNVVYYYEYFPLSVWNNIDIESYVNNIYTPYNLYKFRDYYNISSMTPGYSSLPDVISITNNSSVVYKDGNGTPISEYNIIGVKKFKGPWAKSQLTGNCLFSTEIQTIQIADILEAIDYMNIYGSPVPCGMYELSCDNITTPNSNIAPAINQEVGKEIVLNLDTIVWIWGLFESFQNIANVEIGEFWSPYSGITIQQISETGNLISNIQMSDLFDNEGGQINIPIQLNPGLYCISYHFEDGSFLRVVEEKSNESYNPETMANHLSANIFPVPIQENQFNMTLSATQSMEFEYSLHDFNGDVIYHTNIYIDQGKTETIIVEPEGGIPYGFLINVFSFPDGSNLSIITVKSE